MPGAQRQPGAHQQRRRQVGLKPSHNLGPCQWDCKNTSRYAPISSPSVLLILPVTVLVQYRVNTRTVSSWFKLACSLIVAST